MVGFVSCSKENIIPDEPFVEQSGVPITFAMSNNEPSSTKAHIYTPSNFVEHNTGGGNLSVYAYLHGTETVYINNARVWYFADFLEWEFSEYATEDYAVKLYNCYWPFNYSLDFFAYMPMYPDLSKTAVSNLSYSATNGPSFSCTLPLSEEDQENITEFMYAYTTDKSASNPGGTTQVVNPNGNGMITVNAVPLEFVHPFAVVYLKLKRGHRMTLHNVSFANIKYSGNYNHTEKWSFADATSTLSLDIEKQIPQDINYESVFAGPFIVMPQSLDGVTLGVRGTRVNTNDTNLDVSGIAIKTADVPIWEAGKAYTYSLDLGDNEEEVLFEVMVEAWDKVNYKHVIDVE